MTPELRNTRLRQAADWVRNDGITAPDGKPLGFNMADWTADRHDLPDLRASTRKTCGTVACIAGTIFTAESKSKDDKPWLFGQEWLGLDDEHSEALFLPSFVAPAGAERIGLEGGGFWGAQRSTISPELAARVLEDMADQSSTEADWPGVAQRMIEEASKP